MNEQALDKLLSEQLRQRAEAGNRRLPTNFAYRVMSEVRLQGYRRRVLHARRHGLWESSLVCLFVLPVFLGLFFLVTGYLQMELSVSVPGGGLVPALFILAAFFLLDTRLTLRDSDARSPDA